MNNAYPRLERDVRIEVPSPRNGRPGYRWVQGWSVHYSPSSWSQPLRLADARAILREARRLLKETA